MPLKGAIKVDATFKSGTASKMSWQKSAGQNSPGRPWSAYSRNRAIKLNLLNGTLRDPIGCLARV